MALLCFVAVFAAARSRRAVASTASAAHREKRALVVGSSSVKGALGRLIQAELERSGYEVSRVGVVGAGLARPDYRDMRALVESMRFDRDTAAVFVYLGVNDGQALWLRPGERQRPGERWVHWDDPRWLEVYRERAQRLYDTICRRGVERTLVLLPVEVVKPRLERRLRRIRELQRQAAERVRCATAVSTAGDNGRFILHGQPTRLPDGSHLSALGARVVWDRVVERASLRKVFRLNRAR